jgi:hypothetical protein
MTVTENSVIHIDPAASSMLMADFSDCSTCMAAFSITHMLWVCVALGFCNNVAEHYGLRNTTSWWSKDLVSEMLALAVVLKSMI